VISSTDTEAPKRANPKTDRVDPKRAIDRKANVLPNCAMSNTEIDEPWRTMPKIAKVDPRRAIDRIESVEPK
jgi:hypothetical protein